MPILNIDNYRVKRENANNVDLNRNFETGWGTFNDVNRGPAPLSEPETQAIHNTLITVQPTWFIDYHTGDTRISPPWGYIATPTPDAAYLRSIYDKYALLCQQAGISPLRWSLSTPYGGGLARDEGYHHGAYSYAVELAVSTPVYSVVKDTLAPNVRWLLQAVSLESLKKYTFKQWQDGDTNPSKTVTV